MIRTAVHCNGCGGHLDHVFNDGPPVTGLRYCVNGVALSFNLASALTNEAPGVTLLVLAYVGGGRRAAPRKCYVCSNVIVFDF